ncbi:deacetylvindoline O-acetyltransferase [Daucus carota subsp. sativus]
MAFRGLMRSFFILRRQLHVISRSSTTIKPASPTPSNLKRYNIPLHDLMVPEVYIPFVYFYPSHNSDHSQKLIPDSSSLSYQLKKSLSETLSKYYPFAGRLCSGTYVDCNDEGVQFVEARIGCKLGEVVQKAPVREEEEGLGHLFPPCTIWNRVTEMHSGILMHVQLSHFTCGGIAIAVTLHHHLGDALTILSFLRYWANLSLHSRDHQKLLHLVPQLVYELMPPCDHGDSIIDFPLADKNWITKEVTFPNTNLAKLKAVVENEDKLDGVVEDQKYTRNEILTALLYRCFVAAAAETNAVAENKSVLCRAVNVRRMLDPPLPETSVGNFIVANFVPTSTESETKYRTLVAQMRKQTRQLKGLKKLDAHEVAPIVLEFTKKNYKFYSMSSICGFPVYEAMDFGWGKPIKATIVDAFTFNAVNMMDTADDGVRCLVALGEQDMKNFLVQKELLDYASLK